VLLGILSGVVKFHSNNLGALVDERTLELEKKNKALQVQTKKAQEAAHLKDEFVSIMSHELKTPLNAIIGFSDILLEEIQGPLNDKQKDALNRLSGSAQDLHVLVSNILDLSKLEADQMSLHLSHYRPNEVITEIEKLIPGLMKEKHVKVTVQKDPALQDAVGDVVKIRQIITNLLTNAIKFTKDGSISLSAVKEDEHVVFSVKDTGIGVPKDVVPIIFEAFRQVDGSIRRKYGGTGLGLNIVENYVKRMKGHLEFESEEGKGTHVTVRLPLEVSI
jgi:signal transduction histidine kinase